jgi:protein involved in temperature-dependent protein secretion
MAGIELLEAGPLSAAIKQVAEDVRAKPADVAARTFYFELLCLNGDLERAAKQLDALGAANPEFGVGIYRGAIYVDSQLQEDVVKLGRRTIWPRDSHGFTVAYGQKVITTDQEDCAILDMRSLEVQPCR